MANSFRNDIYRSPVILSYIVMAMLGAFALCSIAFVVMSLVMAFSTHTLVDLGNGESIDYGMGLIGLVALFEIPLQLATVIFFCIWEYRAFNNLSALGAKNLEFSPGWAVGWWFIPFLNLVKPFQVVRELYNNSDPDVDEDGFLASYQGTPEIVGFWWGTYLAGNITFRISNMMIDDRTGQISGAFPVTFLVAGILALASSTLAIIIVREITRRQERRFAMMANREELAPPPPPNFN
jgi:hypothetical protein